MILLGSLYIATLKIMYVHEIYVPFVLLQDLKHNCFNFTLRLL